MVESGIWRVTLTDSARGKYSPDNGLSVLESSSYIRFFFARPKFFPFFFHFLLSFVSSPPQYLFFANCVSRRPTSSPRGETDFIPSHVNRRGGNAATVTTRKFSMHLAPTFHLALKVSTAILFSQRCALCIVNAPPLSYRYPPGFQVLLS